MLGYFTTRRSLQDELAYLLTEAPEEAFFRAEHSARFVDLMRLLEYGRSPERIPVMTSWSQPMWGLAAKVVPKQ
jgi:hypothetical protein